MEQVLKDIKGMVREAKNPRNDGYVCKGYKDELKKIHTYIESQFPDFHYAPTDGYEVGSSEDYVNQMEYDESSMTHTMGRDDEQHTKK